MDLDQSVIEEATRRQPWATVSEADPEVTKTVIRLEAEISRWSDVTANGSKEERDYARNAVTAAFKSYLQLVVPKAVFCVSAGVCSGHYQEVKDLIIRLDASHSLSCHVI